MKQILNKTFSGLLAGALVFSGVTPKAFADRVILPDNSSPLSTTVTTVATTATPISQILSNTTFESAIGGASNWDNTVNRGLSVQTPIDAPDGVQVLQITENAAPAFPFTFQNSPTASVAVGNTINVSAKVKLTNHAGAGQTFEIRVEYKNAADGFISADDDPAGISANTGGVFVDHAVGPYVAPAGTDHVTVVLRIQAANVATNTTVQVDSMSATVTTGAATPLSTNRSTVNGGANDIINPGFESDIGGAGNWDNTANRGISIVTGGAPEGNRYLNLSESAATTGGVFTFQTDTRAVTAGQRATFSGLVRVNRLQFGEAAQLVIEYRTSGGTLVSSDSAS